MTRLQYHRADLATIWLLGDPVAHSMSPLIQNTAIEKLGADALYVAARVTAEDFEKVVRSLPLMGALGANVTVPHKVRAFELCDSLSQRAQLMGAVNTLHFTENGEIYGDNTDGVGWWNALSAGRSFEKAVVIGAGGAARAICHTLCLQGVPRMVILNRTVEKAESLKAELLGHHQCDVAVDSLGSFESELESGCLVVQTTSVGLHGDDCPVEVPSGLPDGVFLSELIYGRETSLMKQFEALGAEVQDGLGMLCGQGAQSLALWLVKKPEEIPLGDMMAVARAQMEARA